VVKSIVLMLVWVSLPVTIFIVASIRHFVHISIIVCLWPTVHFVLVVYDSKISLIVSLINNSKKMSDMKK